MWCMGFYPCKNLPLAYVSSPHVYFCIGLEQIISMHFHASRTLTLVVDVLGPVEHAGGVDQLDACTDVECH